MNTKGELVTKVTRKHSLAGLRGKPFSKRGDSGTFVVDKDGKRILLLTVARMLAVEIDI